MSDGAVANDYDGFLTTLSDTRDFDLIRFGWSMDGNNVLPMLEKIAGTDSISGYESSDASYDGFVAAAEAALDGEDLDAFEENVVAMASQLVTRNVVIPLLYRVSDDYSALDDVEGAWTIQNDDYGTAGNVITFDLDTTTPQITLADTDGVYKTNHISSLATTTNNEDQWRVDVEVTQQDDGFPAVGSLRYWGYFVIGDLLLIDVYAVADRSAAPVAQFELTR